MAEAFVSHAAFCITRVDALAGPIVTSVIFAHQAPLNNSAE